MYKKIYKSMCSVILFTLVISSLFIILVSYSLVNAYMRDKLEEEALITAELLNEKNISLAHLGEDYFSFLKPRIQIYNSDGISLTGGEPNESIKNISEPGFINNQGYAVPLTDGNILCMQSENGRLNTILLIITATAAVILILIYFLSIGIASALTKNIVKPLENIYSYEQDSVYEELEPFVKRIATQGREIKRQENKVKEQKSRLQAISENMNEGLIVVDRNKNILSVNKSILNIFSAKEGDVKHKPFSNLTSSKRLSEYLDKALQGKKDYIAIEKNGKSYQVFYSPVYEKSLVSGVVILLIDVSEKMKTEQIRREFSANVSHELKTPLTAIHGYSQIITGGLAKENDIIGFAAKIEHESLRMINLIDDIIKLSRLDEQSEAPEKEPVNLYELSKDVCGKLAAKAEKRNITLAVSGCDTIISANKIQITEMIYNLCDNAIKYNVPNGKVEIEITKTGFSVSDTGIGIPDEYKDRIFERFFRVDKSHSKNISGTGLGLSIVKHIAISNDASIDVKSAPQKGTSFTVTFNDILNKSTEK